MRGILSLILVFLTSLSVFGQDHGFRFRDKRLHRCEFPFELRANLIVVKLTIDNSDTLNFILDSGVHSTIVLDSSIYPYLHIKKSRKVNISGLGREDPIQGDVSVGHTLNISELTAYKHNLILVSENFLNLSDYLGLHIHGILGSELFYRFHVKIDYLNQMITLSNPFKIGRAKKQTVQLPLYLDKTKPFIIADKLENNGLVVKDARLMLDTGGAHAFILNSNKVSTEFLPKKVIDGHLGNGLNGKIEGTIGRIDQMQISHFHFKKVITNLPDTSYYHENFLRHGSIGGEILKRFIVEFNYTQNFLRLKPIKSKINDPFESDMSGITIKALGKNYKEFEITEIVANSVAEQAGLQVGDRIITINKTVASRLNLSDFYQILSRKEGYPIEMIILRNNSLFSVKFYLKKLI